VGQLELFMQDVLKTVKITKPNRVFIYGAFGC
jgi:hypothetical protein